MKKLFVVFFIVIVLPSSLNINKKDDFSFIYNNFNVENIKLYVKSDDFDTFFEGFNDVNISFQQFNGVNNVYIINSNTLNAIINNNLNYTGVEFLLNKNDNIKKLLIGLNAQVVCCEKVCDRKIIYAFSNKLSKKVVSNGLNINLQVSISDECVKIGYPLLLGAY